MPGSEPWVRIEAAQGTFKVPASVSLLEVWEVLKSGTNPLTKANGELLVRVPLRMVKGIPHSQV